MINLACQTRAGFSTSVRGQVVFSEEAKRRAKRLLTMDQILRVQGNRVGLSSVVVLEEKKKLVKK